MTLEQAFAVRRDVKITQCEYENVYRCIERQGNFFGHAGTIVVQISGRTKRVNQIVLTFDRIDEKFGQGKCKAVLDDILPQLFKVYKPKDAKVRDGGASWYFPKGGEVSLSNFCITDDQGMVLISYRETEGF